MEYVYGFDSARIPDIAVLCVGKIDGEQREITAFLHGKEAIDMSKKLGPGPFITKEQYYEVLRKVTFHEIQI